MLPRKLALFKSGLYTSTNRSLFLSLSKTTDFSKPRGYAGEEIWHYLNQRRLKKWGFVIYRTTYKDDAAWATFMHTLQKELLGGIERDGFQPLQTRLDLKVIEDRALDEASTSEIREKFRNLVLGPFASSELEDSNIYSLWKRAKGDLTAGGAEELKLFCRAFTDPRFRACIQVDEDSLQSVLHKCDDLRSNVSTDYVKCINVLWDRSDTGDKSSIVDEPPTEYESIEGCTSEDVGWIMVPPMWLHLFYSTLMEHAEFGWNNLRWHERPPEIWTPY